MEIQDRPVYSLSPQQNHLWLLQSSQHTPVAQIAVLLEGPLDETKLREAFRASVARHEILHTIFRRQAGMKTPFQVVLDELDPAWEIRKAPIGLSALDAANGFLAQEAEAPFDFETGPLLKILISGIAPDSHILVVTLPSVCADAASLSNLIKEVAAFHAGAPIAAESEPLPYVQFAQWQTGLLEGDDEAAAEGKAFWARHHALTAERPTALPYERRPDSTSPEKPAETGVIFSPVSASLAAKISALASTAEVSESEVLFAAWQSLLARIAANSVGQIGILAAGREYEELSGVIGLVAKVLLVPARIEPGLRFREVLTQTHKAVEEATSWQEYSDPGKSPSATGGVIPVGFAYNYVSIPESAGALQLQLLRIKVDAEPFKLKLDCINTPAGLALEFHYNPAAFTPASIEKLAGYFTNLLTAAVEDPNTEMELLPLLTEPEQKQILYGWNSTEVSFPASTIHALIEQQAVLTPDRIAIRCMDQTLTYAELNKRANQLAHHLRKLGVGAGSLVGLCLDRSTTMMLAVVAILKAGGAYVPLNHDQPTARLQQQLTGAKALLTEQKYANLKALSFGDQAAAGEVLLLDTDNPQWAQEPETNPEALATPDDLVYVIYTSGSTGTPKGVAVRHRNLVNYAHAIADQLKLAANPAGLHFATVSTLAADLGNTSIYPALITGGTLHVIPYEVGTDVRQMALYQDKHPFDVLKIVPSHLAALLASPEGSKVLPKKFLITGGEMLTRGLVEKIVATEATCRIINHYGPTETTVGSLTQHLDGYDWQQGATTSIPIGKPIANTQVYVLDARLQPVPEGVTGELYISGAGLTAGYLGDSTRTAERYITNPFIEGKLMYRTGDLVRFVPGQSGAVEFLGRADDQVKIRGFRVEPGEIEAALLRLPGVRQAVVLARDSATEGDKQLVAYVVATRQGEVTSEALRQSLKDQLPEYMVPFAILVLDKLPLTPNGKIDRNALPDPDEAAPAKEFVEPATDTEREIARIWAEVLHRPQVSADDNFFNLGGHSLTGTQVISRIREHFLVELAFRALFEYPTLRTLAASVDEQKGEATVTAAPIQRAPRQAYRG